ncbi:MAG: T9SS type A sorting domain-containing protein [Bacteroidales bacterium]|nr:T9SS type A sorting domain-containing protein [Bacteroidales bacterium]
MKSWQIIIILIVFSIKSLFSQSTDFRSIHIEQSGYYKNLGLSNIKKFDSINKFRLLPKNFKNTDCSLEKTVFGYQPYWGGSNYLNYQWNLLSDLCYFSYEVDHNTGNPITTHNWLTTNVIDTAKANGVNVHLCVTLFSGHATFFSNNLAQQTLISNLISLTEQRDAKGVNIDFEAVPSSQSSHLTEFIIDLCSQMHNAIPGSVVSIASPAVNWNNTFNIPALNEHIDLFIIMGYDYYWNGSSQAGPVSGLYSMTGNYNYNLSRTISYYQSEGVSKSKLVLGLPYYGRQWPTESQTPPSNTTGNGTALTYANVMNNSSGYYTNENKHWEGNSFSPYFAFFTDEWNQCFIDDVYSFGKRYDIVIQRGLAGIGIWALGYDNGYTELWNLISDKFTDCALIPCSDTIFDSGGQAFEYYNNEDYEITITSHDTTQITLTFNTFELESGYDSLWIFDGPDMSYPLIGGYSGIVSPETIYSSDNSLTLSFYSDNATTEQGWEAVWECFSTFIHEKNKTDFSLSVYPNPFIDNATISYFLDSPAKIKISITDLSGKSIILLNEFKSGGYYKHIFSPESISLKRSGIYVLNFYINNYLKKTLSLIWIE